MAHARAAVAAAPLANVAEPVPAASVIPSAAASVELPPTASEDPAAAGTIAPQKPHGRRFPTRVPAAAPPPPPGAPPPAPAPSAPRLPKHI